MNNRVLEHHSATLNDLDLQRRARLLRALASGFGGLTLLSVIALVFSPRLPIATSATVSLIAAGLAYWLAPRRIDLGTWILIGGFTMSLLVHMLNPSNRTVAALSAVLPFLTLHVLTVGMLVGTRALWVTTVLIIVITWTIIVTNLERHMWGVAVGMNLLTLGVAGLTWLFIQGVAEVQNLLKDRNIELEQAAREREHLMTELEARAHEAEGQRAEALHLLEDLRRSQEATTLLQSTVQQLTTPALVVGPQVLAIPLIGTFDRDRALQLQQMALQSIERMHAHTLILDVTGLTHVDTAVARTFIETAQAAQLLGARCILAGVQPAVAETLVQLGVTLPDLRPAADLQSALALTLR
jgi:rsbT co-antagonist protein RsbR